ncbi:MAG: serine protease [Roseovarius sp.]
MTRTVLSFLLFLFFSAFTASAQQQSSWIQLESHPNLAVTEQAIRAYGARIDDVNGFNLGGGWYAVALGPYSADEVDNVMVSLREQGLIPRDSYVASSTDYQQQFWPVGANLLNDPGTDTAEPAEGVTTESVEVTDLADALAEAAGNTETTETDPGTAAETELAQADTGTDTAADTGSDTTAQTGTTQPEVVAEPEIPEETQYEARQNEAQLTAEERRQLQIALEWAGHYQGAIDAAIGPGTRGAMADWQRSNGHEPTGVMTTRQRAELLGQYNTVLDGLNIRTVRDTEAGVQMKLPTGVVAFDRYESPFAHYDASGDIPEARVLMISQPGDRNTLLVLYDIMQTLRIVPEDGPREISGNSFSLTGRNASIVSQTEASLENGHVKGFTLIWPAGDEDRRTRLMAEMQASFQRLDGVLDPGAGGDVQQEVDLVSGLEIRQPKLSRSGFYVDQSGTVVTTLEAVQGCERVTLDEDYNARVIGIDEALGIAVLKPVDALAPIAVAAFQDTPPRLQSDIAVAGYSYGGILGSPTLTFGQLADARGLNGEENLKRLALASLEGDAGGPVVDAYGAVVGMLLPAAQSGRQLPDGVSFAADAAAVRQVLADLGINPSSTSGGTTIPPETLSKQASGMTVLVSCWD